MALLKVAWGITANYNEEERTFSGHFSGVMFQDGEIKMSLAAIQDNLVKAPLVQQTQTRGDDVARGQEIAQTANQREQNRQEDQVVIHTRESENQGIRTDEEREKEQRKKKQQQEEEEEEQNAEGREDPETDPKSETGTRMVMHRINIVI